MDLSLTMQVSVPKNVLVRTFENESLLLNLDTESYYGLDEIGIRIWQALTQTENIQAAYESLLAEYDVDPVTLQRDLEAFIESLVQRGLMELHNS